MSLVTLINWLHCTGSQGEKGAGTCAAPPYGHSGSRCFSRLTGTDEERTLTRLRALGSDLIEPTIVVRNGRVVKRTGDGILIEFRSVVDAVRSPSRCRTA